MNKEQIYDSEISPLMAKIIATCKQHKIAFVASFDIPTAEDADLRCTSALLTDECEPGPGMLEALRDVKTPGFHALAITVRTGG